MPDYSGIKQQQKNTWATGDFAIIGWNTVFPGELLCEAVDPACDERFPMTLTFM